MYGRSATGPPMTRRTTIVTTRDLRKTLTRKRMAVRKETMKSTMMKMMMMMRS